MRFERQRRHVIDLLFTLVLFAVFAVLSLLIVMIGANAYKSTAARMDDNYTTRTALAYITEKVHQYDNADSICLTQIEEVPALSLTETIQDTRYITYIYYYGGHICELFTRAEDKPALKQGTALIEAQGLWMETETDGSFKLTVTDRSGNRTQTYVRPVCG